MLKHNGSSINSANDLSNFKKLKKEFDKNKNIEIKVGFPSNNSKTISKDKEGKTALFKATINNYGLGVPKRPFMDIAFSKNINKYKKFLAKNLFKKPFMDILNILGSVAQGDVVKTISDLKNPPNSDATIRLKGADDPLIDSGHMISSVTYSLVDIKK